MLSQQILFDNSKTITKGLSQQIELKMNLEKTFVGYCVLVNNLFKNLS